MKMNPLTDLDKWKLNRLTRTVIENVIAGGGGTGPPGPPGPAGPTGPQGPAGADGMPGEAHIGGDVKTSLASADHSHWYLLDGRAVSSLPATAQAVAALLGYDTNLPDSSQCCLKSDPFFTGEITGVNNITLNRNQLPNVTLSGTTNTTGNHVHTQFRGDGGAGMATPGYEFNDATGRYAYDGDPSIWMSANGDHSHTVTTESLNGGVVQQSIDITPKSFNVNFFVWLA